METDQLDESTEIINDEDDDDDLDDLDDEDEDVTEGEHLGTVDITEREHLGTVDVTEGEHLGSVDEDGAELLQDDVTEDNLTHGSESANISLSEAMQAVANNTNVDKFSSPERHHICGVSIFYKFSNLQRQNIYNIEYTAPCIFIELGMCC